MSSKFSDTGLLDFKVKHTGFTPDVNIFELLRAAVGEPIQGAALNFIERLPYVCWKESRLELGANNIDVLILTQTDKSKEGLVIVQDKGVYQVISTQYSWRDVQRLDLFVTVDENKNLFLDSLK